MGIILHRLARQRFLFMISHKKNWIIPFNLVEIPTFPPYVGNIGMATYLVGVMAAAQNRKLMHVWDAAATSCPMNRHHSDEAQRSRNLFTRLKRIILKKIFHPQATFLQNIRLY